MGGVNTSPVYSLNFSITIKAEKTMTEKKEKLREGKSCAHCYTLTDEDCLYYEKIRKMLLCVKCYRILTGCEPTEFLLKRHDRFKT